MGRSKISFMKLVCITSTVEKSIFLIFRYLFYSVFEKNCPTKHEKLENISIDEKVDIREKNPSLSPKDVVQWMRLLLSLPDISVRALNMKKKSS